MTELYGSATVAQRAGEDYESPDEYAGQGDTRVVRDLMFSYLVANSDAAGNTVLEPREAYRNEEVTTEQIGLAALEKGERHHSFYTDAELEMLAKVGAPSAPISADTDISSLGEYELSEWLASENPSTGRAWTINEVLEQVGNDKDLANRMLAAENIRGDGDPRTGLEAGLTRIIES